MVLHLLEKYPMSEYEALIQWEDVWYHEKLLVSLANLFLFLSFIAIYNR